MKLSKTKQYLIKEMKKAINEEEVPFKFMYKNKIPVNYDTKIEYKGINKINLWLAERIYSYDDPRWITFNQAKKLGLEADINNGKSVLSGKGIPISYYSYVDKLTNKTVSISKVNEMIENNSRTKEDFYFFEKDTYVFNASLFNNIDKYIENDEIVLDKDIEESVDDIINSLNIKVENTDEYLISAKNKGYCFYSPKEDIVYMPNKNLYPDKKYYYGNLLHEIAHATGHNTRMARNLKSYEKDSLEYAREELTAEIASVFLCNKIGVTPSDEMLKKSKGYINSWLNNIDSNPIELNKAIKNANEIEQYCDEEVEKFINSGRKRELLIEKEKKAIKELAIEILNVDPKDVNVSYDTAYRISVNNDVYSINDKKPLDNQLLILKNELGGENTEISTELEV